MRKVAAVLAFVAALAGGWFYFRSRAITVWLFTDSSFRQKHADWPALVDARFREVNRIFQRNDTGVRWKVVDSTQTDPTGTIPGIDNRRANMVFHIDKRAEVFVVITGAQEGARTGSVSPFTRTAIIVDFPDKSDTFNGRLMAHELAHLFGAPHDPAWLESLMGEKPESSTFTPATRKLIQRLRNYPFDQGIDALITGGWESTVLSAVAQDNTGSHTNPEAHAHTLIGTALLNERKMDAALVHFLKAVKADPNNTTLHLNMAEAYTRNGQDELALEQGREVLRLAPNDPFSHRALGALLSRTNRVDEAVQELRLAAAMEPQNPDTKVLLGAQLMSLYGHIDEGISILEEAVRINPETPMARESLEKAKTVKERVAETLTNERTRIRSNSSDADAYYRLAKAEAISGDLAGAIRDYQKNAELRPTSGVAHVELAEIFCYQKDFPNAWAEVRKARALGTEPPPLLVSRLPAQK